MTTNRLIEFAIAYNSGDPSVGIWEHTIQLGGKGNELCDLSVYAEDEQEEIMEELRGKLQEAMELCMDSPKIYFDFEWKN